MRPTLLCLAMVLMLIAAPVLAFDCTRAATAVEQAICGDPSLKAIDDRLGKAYADLRALTSEPDRAALAATQKRWIKRREACGDSADPPECVASQTNERTALLSGTPASGTPASGPGIDGMRLVPFFLWQNGSDNTYAIDATLLRFVDPQSPGERRFNQMTAELGDSLPFGLHGDDPNPNYDVVQTITVDFLSDHLLSATVSTSSYTGGAHGNYGRFHVNIDMTSGRDLLAKDLFTPQALQKLVERCTVQITATKTARALDYGTDYDPATDVALQGDTIADHVADLTRWALTDREARVDFDPYSVGSYAEGAFECRFPLGSP